jgi:hypothetical protein
MEKHTFYFCTYFKYPLQIWSQFPSKEARELYMKKHEGCFSLREGTEFDEKWIEEDILLKENEND